MSVHAILNDILCAFSYLIEVNQVLHPALNANFRLALPNRLDIGFSSDERNESNRDAVVARVCVC